MKNVIPFLFLTSFYLVLADKETKPTVFVQKMVPVPLSDSLSYPVKVLPKIQSTVLSEIDGVVESILVTIGQEVKKGSALLKMKQVEPGYEFQSMTLRSPVKGVVSNVFASQGSRFPKGKNLIEITNPEQVKILFEIPFRDLQAIKTGQVGKLSLESGTADVSIVGMSPVVDAGTNTSTAELALLKKINLKPGTLTSVAFQIRAHEGFELPEQAIVYKGKDSYVRTIVDGVAKYKPIELGPFRNGKLEVLKGLTKGDDVVLQASQFVAEGEAVDIHKKD